METQFLTHHEGTLAYSDYGGGGQPVIMLPGIGALRTEYRYLAPKLREAGYRAVTLDLRGQGESSVPWKTYDVPSVGGDILALIEHLNAGPAHLIGTSFAAASVVWTASKHPDYVLSTVLITGFVRRVKINPIMKMLYWFMTNNPWRVRTWLMYYKMMYPSKKPPDFQDYLGQLAENLAQPGRFEAANALANSSRQPSEDGMRHLKVPTLVIMGSKDPDFPDPQAEGKSIVEQTKGKLVMLDGAGHYPQTEMPEETANVILEFLKQSSKEYVNE